MYFRKLLVAALFAAAGLPLMAPGPAQAKIIYQDLPAENSTLASRHGAGGPILADDFIPIKSTLVTRVDWWGTSAPTNSWELAFHTNDPATNTPTVHDAFSGASAKLLATTAAGVHIGGGIFFFSIDVSSLGLNVVKGATNWITIANDAVAASWNWALANGGPGPEVGGQNFAPLVSTGSLADGDVDACLDFGPHCGPWSTAGAPAGRNLAFRVHGVPEPGTLILFAIGLAGLGFMARRRRIAAYPDAA